MEANLSGWQHMPATALLLLQDGTRTISQFRITDDLQKELTYVADSAAVTLIGAKDGVDASLQSGDYAAFMRDFTGVVQFGEVGEGNLDWTEIIDQAIASGAQYLLIEQDDQYGWDPFDCLRTSRANLLDLGYADLF